MADTPAPTASLQEYERLTAASQSAFASARELPPTGVSRQTLVYQPYPIYAERGAGQHLWDLDGNRYLDFVNNYTSLIHGHGYSPSVLAAAAELGRGGALGAPTALEREYVEFLQARFPVAKQIRFALSGSEAVSYALCVARAATEGGGSSSSRAASTAAATRCSRASARRPCSRVISARAGRAAPGSSTCRRWSVCTTTGRACARRSKHMARRLPR